VGTPLALGSGQTIFYAVLVTWSFSEIVGSGIIPAIRARGSIRKKRDRGSSFVVRICITFSMVIAFYFAFLGLALLPDWAFYVGIVLIFSGIVVRQWAIAVLGRFFSLVVRVQRDQRVVDNGPYRFVRHPSYTGTMMTLLGLGLALQSWAGILVIMALFAVGFSYRIKVEEKALVSQLGQKYVSYAKRTKRIIPFVI